MPSKEPITVVNPSVSPGTTDVQEGDDTYYTFDFTTDGYITGISASTYVGQQLDLQYRFYLYKEEQNSKINLIQPLDKEFIAGNGETFDFDIRRAFENGDELHVAIENDSVTGGDVNREYHANARVFVDYDPSIIDRIRGLL